MEVETVLLKRDRRIRVCNFLPLFLFKYAKTTHEYFDIYARIFQYDITL